MKLPLLHAHPDCQECELHQFANNPGMASIHLEESLPSAPTRPCVLFVGQNPGFHEDDKNEPFIGRSGKVLREAYIPGCGVANHASIYIGNAVRCYTVDNQPPAEKSRKACAPHLLDDIAQITQLHNQSPQPLAVVCLGAGATQTLWKHILHRRKGPLAEAFKAQGELVHIPQINGSIAIFATYHPAYFLRNPNCSASIGDHLKLLSSYVLGNTPAVSPLLKIPPRKPIP